MAIDPPKRRRWLPSEFGVVLLLAVVLVSVGGWVGVSLMWIHKRHQMTHETALWRWPDFRSNAPGGLWLFGEPGYPEMTLWCGDGSSDIARSFELTRSLFPETNVRLSYQEGAIRIVHPRLDPAPIQPYTDGSWSGPWGLPVRSGLEQPGSEDSRGPARDTLNDFGEICHDDG